MENDIFNIELKQGDYFNYGQHYFVEFKYGTEEQQRKMYELFEKALIPSYGSHSQRANDGKEYIMPYFATENGAMTPNNTGRIGGTSIPEDLLPEFIRRFVEVDKATVKVGEQQIKDNFDYEVFNTMVENLGLKIELKQGDYFNYGQHYFVEFKYGTEEQQRKMYELFEKALIPSYGSHSQRANDGKEYIMPYFATENGAMTPNNTGRIGGTSIPEDLLPEFIRRFVEVDKATVKVGEQQIKDNFDYEVFNTMVENLGLKIELKQGDYFNYGQHYFVEFKYGTEEQQRKIYELFEKALIPSYGSHSQRANDGKEYIMPYFATENGAMTPNNTGRIGGTSIPEDLLPEFIRRFVEVDKATVKVGEQQIKDNFDYEVFNSMLETPSNKKR